MTTNNSEAPLFGWQWNEAEMDTSLQRGMLTLIAFNDEGVPFGLGTAFVVSREDRVAVCVTAAHVFTEVRRIQSPPQRYVPSALPEFLPPPRAIDLSEKKIRAIATEGDRVEVLIVDGAVIDEVRDIAVFRVSLQNEDTPAFFSAEFEADDKVPAAGDLVCVLSYGGLSTFDFETDGAMKRQFKMGRGIVLRVGRVIAHYPSRPLKNCFSNASGRLMSKTRAAQTRLRSDCNGPSGRFAVPPAHFGRTYPWAHA